MTSDELLTSKPDYYVLPAILLVLVAACRIGFRIFRDAIETGIICNTLLLASNTDYQNSNIKTDDQQLTADTDKNKLDKTDKN